MATGRTRSDRQGEVREFEIEKDEDELAEEQKDAVEKNPYINHSSPDLKQLLKKAESLWEKSRLGGALDGL